MNVLRKLEYCFRLTKILCPFETRELIPWRSVLLKQLRIAEGRYNDWVYRRYIQQAYTKAKAAIVSQLENKLMTHKIH
jgi:hypothetical protein